MAPSSTSSITSRNRIRPVATPTALSLLLAVLLLAAALWMPDRIPTAFGQTGVAAPQFSPVGPQRPISFRDRLVAGLQARLRSEVAFIDAVIVQVQAGNLPQRLVDETFFWARERASTRLRRGRQRRPIIYFQPALAARAARLGVPL